MQIMLTIGSISVLEMVAWRASECVRCERYHEINDV